jgi:hypothetical protein
MSCACCTSCKTWCRVSCFVATVAHGSLFAAIATCVVLGIPLKDYFPLARLVRVEFASSEFAASASAKTMDLYISCALIGTNFLYAVPYIIVAAYGTRSACLLFVAFFFCTVEIFELLSLLALAVATSGYVTGDMAIVRQWLAVGLMVTLLLTTWSLLLSAWKVRWQERAEERALHTATLISGRKMSLGRQFQQEPSDGVFVGRCRNGTINI